MYWEDRHNAIVPDDTDFQNIKHKKYAKKTANTNQITPPQKKYIIVQMHAKSNPGMLTLDHGLFYQYALVDNAQTGKEN